MRSRRELIDLVLDNLGVLVPGQPASAEYVATIDAAIDPFVAEFNCYFECCLPAHIERIPECMFVPFGHVLADEIANGFALTPQPDLRQLWAKARHKLDLEQKHAKHVRSDADCR